METGLAGKSVLVTGATANIGRAIAFAFAGEGCRLGVVGRDAQRGTAICEELREAGAGDAVWHAADVTDLSAVTEMVAAVTDRLGPVEVLVNNVGGNCDVGLFTDSHPPDWDREIALNFTSTLNCTHSVLPSMIRRSTGRIINIGSTSGIVGDPALAIYSAMKGAVHAFTKVLAKEVGQQGITVNAIAPYGTAPDDIERDTSAGSRWRPGELMTQLLDTKGDVMAVMARKTLLERQLAKPSEVAAAAVYLASDAAAFVTAQVLCVDGGTLVA